MELNSFASKSMSSSEIVRVGRTCSAPLSSFRHKFSVKFSTQFKCRRGLLIRSYHSGASDNSPLANKALNSVSPNIVAAETSSYGINGINGSSSTSNLFSKNMRILYAFDDEYGGVVIDPEKLPANPYSFVSSLRSSLSHWKQMGKKGIWLKLLLKQSDLVPLAVKEGFQYHHAEPGYVMLTYWIPEGPCQLPANASHQVGVGGFVVNDKDELLVVREKHCSAANLGLWKIPTGFILEAEEIYTGAIREVKEETGIDTEFVEVTAFRHAHKLAFQKSDLFFVCMLRPLSTKIVVDDLEIEDAKWMPLVEFVEQPLIQEDSLFKKISDICIARLQKRYCGLCVHHMISKFDGKSSSLYYNVVDIQDINCFGN
ncbi:hypothetical protein L6164_019656 [Bauhinia variegata]|uniref:Uncharacterized protein n=1 Tax=Bauhinia variegata TaxID=167791 RepID=A0ACB9MTW9_BAUVA|nr:hypothetical protein L6164_019656 [Bauhinia variegata]